MRIYPTVSTSYFGAKGVERNMTTAFKWFSAAAEAGDHSAQADLAHLYLHGLGVEQDNSSALVLFTAAAEAGVASAINGLGYMCVPLCGCGVVRRRGGVGIPAGHASRACAVPATVT